MVVTLALCVVVLCSWPVDGYPAKESRFQVNHLSKNEQKDIVFSTDMSNSFGPKGLVGRNVGQFRPEADWMYQLMDSLDGRGTRHKRHVKKQPGKRKDPLRNSKPVHGKKRVPGRKSVRNSPAALPESQNEGVFKTSLRDILILGSKHGKTSTQRNNSSPSGSSQKKPRRSNKGSFSIVPAKPKSRRGWRLRSRSRARAGARSGARKPKKTTRKTVRRGFVILD